MRNALVIVAVCLAACSSPAEFEARAWDRDFTVRQPYQVVYAHVLHAMRLCTNPGASFFPSPGAVTLDGQLYPDLGYGEIISGISGVFPQSYGAVRVDRAGAGSRVRIKAGVGTDWARANSLRWMEYWAGGGTACSKIGAMTPPN